MHAVAITPLYAGILGLVLLALSYRVSHFRLRFKVGIGDGGRPELVQAVDLAIHPGTGEVVAEHRVPAQPRRPHKEGHERRGEDALPHVGRPADAAYLR